MKVAAIGDNVVDLYLNQKMMYLGGNSLNFANFASEMDSVESMYVGNFGNDVLSEYVQTTLDKLSVNHRLSRILNGASGYSLVKVEDGDRTFLGSNQGGVLQNGILLSKSNIDYLNDFDLVHFNANGNADEWLCKIAKPKIIYDYSDFDSIEQVRNTVKFVDIACFSMANKTNSEVANKLSEIVDISENDQIIILITRGELGAQAYYAGHVFKQPAERVKHVVDTMGAGDSFITSFGINIMKTGITGFNIKRALKQASLYSAKNILVNGSFDHGAKVPNSFLNYIIKWSDKNGKRNYTK
ncbi:PfkB family carbohydrate kinase [Paucilactobacillus kaifaensis]|uniref:PfkB family carbohydrate kinase n=1 Tax=Paucilactobacillus kaifaensis TaxID=2559921 RepID=UPI0010F9DEF5|nr:PfkB family carbohydrate kinase [Paucilactobacillus kaifaensis]